MQIIGIDHEHTQHIDNVAFVVDVPPDLEVLAKVRISGSVRIEYKDSLLYVNTTNSDYDIDKQLINHINKLYRDNESEINKQRQEKASSHERAVCSVSTRTGLNIRDSNGQYRGV